MFNNTIEFHGPNHLLEDEDIRPVPAIKNLPNWYKDLESDLDKNSHKYNGSTIKKCIPFLDAITAGYILKLHQDIEINFNFYNEKTKQQDINVNPGSHNPNLFFNKMCAEGLGYNNGNEYHPISQVGGKACPFTKQNSNLPFIKLINTWNVVTPKGYSTLYLPIINNKDERFTPISGIVDTDDNYYTTTNFPIIVHKTGRFLLKKGTPIVTVFPFKRDNWKMKVKEIDTKKFFKDKATYFYYLKEWYKRKFWKKKRWK